ncbi:MAG: EamA family transporter [Rhizobium sp.]|nr:EamA family transporter [Rhizobium sp.]
MKGRHILLALLCAALWGGSFSVINWGLHDLPPLAFAGLRFAMVAALVLVIPRPKVPFHMIMLYGFTWGAMQFGGLFIALNAGLPTGLSSLLAQTQVFFTVVFVGLLKWETLRVHHYFGLLLACCGLAFVSMGHEYSVPPLAILSSLLGATGWAIGNLVVRSIHVSGAQADTPGFIIWASLVPTIVLGGLSMLSEDPEQLKSLEIAEVSRIIAAVTYQSIAALLLGSMAWNHLLRHYKASIVAPFSLLVPVVGLTIGISFMHESLTPLQTLGRLSLTAALGVNLRCAPLTDRANRQCDRNEVHRSKSTPAF